MSADLNRPAHDGPRPRAPDRVLLRGVRLPRLVPDLLGRPRRPRRRHPQGGVRPRVAAWSRSASSTATATSASGSTTAAGSTSTGSTPTRTGSPAALVRDDAGEPITVSVTVGTEAVVAQIWRTNVGRIPLYLLDAERPENSESARWITSRLYIGDEDTRLRPVPAARHRRRRGRSRRWASTRASCTSTRATRRSPRSSCAKREYSGQGSLGAALDIARQRTIFTTHTPVPGRQRHVPRVARSRTCSSTWRARWASTPRRIISLGRTNPAERGREPFGVTQSRAAHEPRRQRCRPPPARSPARCGRRCGPTRQRRRRADQPRHQRRASRPGWRQADLEPASTSTSATDWLDRATEPAHLGARSTSVPAKASCGTVRREPLRRPDRVRPPWRGGRPPRRAASRGRSRRRPRRAFDPDALTVGFARRFATYKRAEPASCRTSSAIAALVGDDRRRRSRCCLAGKAHPRDRRRQVTRAAACSA